MTDLLEGHLWLLVSGQYTPVVVSTLIQEASNFQQLCVHSLSMRKLKAVCVYGVEVGDRIGMLIDKDDSTLHFFHNGMDLGLSFDNFQSEALLIACSVHSRQSPSSAVLPSTTVLDPIETQDLCVCVTTQQYRKRI